MQWQDKQNKTVELIGSARTFLNDAEWKYAIAEHSKLIVVWELKNFKVYLYEKEFTVKSDHQALQPLLLTNIAHEQYIARLTRSIDGLPHFDVTALYCAGNQLSLTNFLSKKQVEKPLTK